MMSLEQHLPFEPVRSAADGLRTAAKLARMKAEIVAKAQPEGQIDPIGDAFVLFAEELDVIASHIDNLEHRSCKGQ